MVACLEKQMVARVMWQIVAAHRLPKNKTAFSDPHHSVFVINWLVKLFERDGSYKKAGDGIRTRDSLLGRQELYH